jgi:ketosteroid isomerase-like protein
MKKINLRSVFMLFGVLFTTSIAFSQSAAEYKTKIEALNKEMAKNMLAGTNEKSLSLYTDDAISLPNYEPMHDGIAAIKKANEDMAKSGWKFVSFETTTLKVLPNGNMITEIGTYKMSGSMPGMDKPVDDHGKYVTIWEKQKDGSLKMKVETWNSDVDPKSMMKTADQSKMEKKDK